MLRHEDARPGATNTETGHEQMAGAHHHVTAQGLQTLDVARGVGALLGTIGGTVLDADDMVAYAAEYAVAGWEVFPLRGKVPAIRGGRGVLDATTDLTLIGAWWTKFHQANIGLRVASHVIVVDTDPRHGGDVGLEQLVERHGPLPATLPAASGPRRFTMVLMNLSLILSSVSS